jgi:hypothetical protein
MTFHVDRHEVNLIHAMLFGKKIVPYKAQRCRFTTKLNADRARITTRNAASIYSQCLGVKALA